MSSKSLQIDITVMKVDSCEPKNVIGPNKGKTSDSECINDVVQDKFDNNLSFSKKDDVACSKDSSSNTIENVNMIRIDIDHTPEMNKEPPMNIEDTNIKIYDESSTEDSNNEFNDSLIASYIDKIKELYYNVQQLFNFNILLRIITCICFISLGYYLSNCFAGILRYLLVMFFLITLPDIYSLDIFFEVYEILIDLVTILHHVRKIRKRSFSYLRGKIKNLFAFEKE